MKKLIVLATLAALPAVAMADVVITGDLGVAINNVKNKDDAKAGTANGTSANNMSRQTGQIIFKGTEDLGNGLKSIFQIATRIDASGNELAAKNQWGRRDTFVGLAGDFGTVRIGQLSTTANSGYAAADPFEQLTISGDGVLRNVAEYRTNNTVRYDSPVIAGFSGALAVQLRPEAAKQAVTTTLADQAAAHTSSLGLKYATGPVTATYSRTVAQDQLLAIGNQAANTARDAKTTIDQFALVYAADALTVGFNYAKAKGNSGLSFETPTPNYAKDVNVKQAGYDVYASYAVGAFTPVIAFHKEGKLTVDGKDTAGSYNVVSLGTNYALSKRTSAGVEMQFQGGRDNIAANDGSKFGKKNTTSVYLTTSF